MASMPPQKALPFRIGIGFDIHPFVAGRPLILGGVTIPYHLGLGGHSDADALCHAITDALLGAVGLGDIGRHFPDTDPRYQGANSLHLLQSAYAMVIEQGYLLGNLDANIITEKPKLAEHFPRLVAQLAQALNIPANHINLKGKTHEKMDAIGEGKALAVQAVVMLSHQD